MPEPSLTVVIPTIGRKTLTHAIRSVTPQLKDGDEIIVVADLAGDFWGASKRVSAAQKFIKPPAAYTTFAVCPANEEKQGYEQRTYGLLLSRTSHVCFLDDDDIYTPNALDLFREAACDVPVIFKMEYGSDKYASKEGDQLWTQPMLVYGNVGTPMFVVPNEAEKLGLWKAHTEINGKLCGGDFTFISGCVEKSGGAKWREEVVAIVRPRLLPRGVKP